MAVTLEPAVDFTVYFSRFRIFYLKMWIKEEKKNKRRKKEEKKRRKCVCYYYYSRLSDIGEEKKNGYGTYK